jgi:ATP-dependent helicase YprA (DUF1998 family)
MSSYAFHRTPGERIRETTAVEQFRLGNLELFKPAAQEIYGPATIPTKTQTNRSLKHKLDSNHWTLLEQGEEPATDRCQIRTQNEQHIAEKSHKEKMMNLKSSGRPGRGWG